MQALMETEQSLRDRAIERKRKQRVTTSQESRTKEREHDRVSVYRESLAVTGKAKL